MSIEERVLVSLYKLRVEHSWVTSEIIAEDTNLKIYEVAPALDILRGKKQAVHVGVMGLAHGAWRTTYLGSSRAEDLS